MSFNGWKTYRLEEISTKIMVGIASAATHAYRDSGIPMLRNQNIREAGIEAEEILYIDPDYEKSHRNKRLATGDVLTVRTGYPGLSAVVDERFSGAQCFTSLITRPNTNLVRSDYLCYYINSPVGQRFFSAGEAGGAQKNVNAGVLKKLPVLLPPLPEQRKIAQILSTWDKAISLNEKVIAAEQQRLTALMGRLLFGKVRFTEFSDKAWQYVPIGDLVTLVKRPVEWDDNQLYKLASIRRHSKGMFYREPAYGHQIKVKKLCMVKTGDFLLSNIQAAYGAMGVVPKKFDGSYISDQYTVLEPKNTKSFDIRFLGYVSELPWFRHQIILSCNGFFAERLRLLFSADALMKRKLFVPPTVQEQRRIIKVVVDAYAKLAAQKRKHKMLKDQKLGLMQQLLTGNLPVAVSDEPVVMR